MSAVRLFQCSLPIREIVPFKSVHITIFFETNLALQFDRAATRGFRPDIPAGTGIRFEPGQQREIQLVAFGGLRRVYGFRGEVMGELESKQ